MASEYYDHSIELLSIFKAESNKKFRSKPKKFFEGAQKKNCLESLNICFNFGSLGQVSALTLTYCAPNSCAPFDCQRFSFLSLSSLPSHCLHSSIMSATCHAKCPLICLWRSLRNLHFICTTCDPDELPPFPLPPPSSLLLCLPDCSQLPLRIQFFIFMRRLDCPPASGINAFPSITLPPYLPPHLCTISGWRLSFDLCLASLLSLSLYRCRALRLQVFTSDLPCCLVL